MHFETEEEWLACADPREIAWHCKNRDDESQFRWLLIRWGERIRPLLSIDDGSFFVAFAEWAIAGRPKPRHPHNVQGYLSKIGESARDAATVFVGELSRYWLIYASAGAAIAAARAGETRHDEIAQQFANEFRDVAGDPFRPVAFDPAWRTEAVVGLATGIDESGAYERLPILADALQEAGCEDEQVLTHARGPGPHVRGCWLIDRILGRW